MEEDEQRRCLVELAVPTEEGRVSEEAELGFADQGRADKVGGLIGQDAEEDLANELVHQCRWRAGRCGGLGLSAFRLF